MKNIKDFEYRKKSEILSFHGRAVYVFTIHNKNNHVCGLIICRSEFLARNAVNRPTAMRGVTGVCNAIRNTTKTDLGERFSTVVGAIPGSCAAQHKLFQENPPPTRCNYPLTCKHDVGERGHVLALNSEIHNFYEVVQLVEFLPF